MAKQFEWSGHGFFYLGSPLTHDEAAVRYERYQEAIRAAAWLTQRGIWCYSPIIQTFEMSNRYKMPYTFEFWDRYNQEMIKASQGMFLLMLDGWEKSAGLTAELTFCWSIACPVWGMRPMLSHAVNSGYVIMEHIRG